MDKIGLGLVALIIFLLAIRIRIVRRRRRDIHSKEVIKKAVSILETAFLCFSCKLENGFLKEDVGINHFLILNVLLLTKSI